MKAKKNTKNSKDCETFALFCKQHKIAEDSIKWRVVGDRCVKLSVEKGGGLSLLSVALMFALRELKVDLSVTIRESKNEKGDIEIVVEK